MPKGGVVPNCRYGHGELKKINEASQLAFGLIQHVHKANSPLGLNYVSTTGAIILDAYECPRCGYTELFERQEP